jgi:hypothetical protein
MVRVILAGFLVNRGADSLELGGDPEKALRLTGRSLRLIGARDRPLARVHAGRAHHVRAEAYLQLDHLDEAIDSYAKAEAKLSVDPKFIEHYVRCLHDAAITFEKRLEQDEIRLIKPARPTGFEPVTFGFVDRPPPLDERLGYEACAVSCGLM